MKKTNETKTNATINFTDIEKTVANMCIGTKCSYTKYNDNKNGYIGVKVGNKNIFSMYHLKNENSQSEFIIGLTDDVYNTLSNSKFATDTDVKLTKNTNNGDTGKRVHNAFVNGIKKVYELYQFVINHYTTPQTTETK